MKKILSAVILGGVVAGPFAAGAAVSDRLSCDEISAEISRLSGIEDATDDDTARLKDLRAQYRRSCQKAAGGRLANARATQMALASKTLEEVTAPVVQASDVAPAAPAAADSVDSFLAKKQENCAALLDAIAAKKNDATADTADIEKMQAQYDADCAEKTETTATVTDADTTATETAADTEPAPDPAELAAAEAARIAELRANGKCPDESKPNKFGCCAGEKFKETANLTFACCNEETDECLAPISKN